MQNDLKNAFKQDVSNICQILMVGEIISISMSLFWVGIRNPKFGQKLSKISIAILRWINIAGSFNSNRYPDFSSPKFGPYYQPEKVSFESKPLDRIARFGY